MSRNSILKSKSLAFALKIIELKKFLKDNHNETILSKQVLRSGTAIGALIREAEHAASKRDFLNKLVMALKEANETLYWLELLNQGAFITQRMFYSLNSDAEELVKMLVSSIKTVKRNLGMPLKE